MKISAVVTSRNEGPQLRSTIDQLLDTLPAGSEIVVVDDGSTDGSADALGGSNGEVGLLRTENLGVARARNHGAAESAGEVLIFLDAHLELGPRWWEPLLEAVGRPGAGAAATAVSVMGQPNNKGFGLRLARTDLAVEWLGPQGGSPFRAPILPGCCLAMPRQVFEATGGFDAGLRRWGESDNELSLRLWLLGYELWVAPQVEVAHLFRRQRPYPMDWASVVHNKLRLAFVHFDAARIAAVVEALRSYPDFPAAVAMMAGSDVQARRGEMLARRVHDDAWYFEKFGALAPVGKAAEAAAG